MTRMKIYVAGPMYRKTSTECHSPKVCWTNIRRAIKVGMQLYRKGHAPYIPHLNALIDVITETNLKGDEWIENFDFPWLEKCDALFFIGHSLGADKELEYAKKLGLKIYYYKVDEVPDA